MTQRFAVYEHAEAGQVTGRGFVVRKCDETGRADDQFNYAGQTPVRGRSWKSQAVAEGVAHRLNNPPQPCGSGWTSDRCSKPLGHKGPHSNE